MNNFYLSLIKRQGKDQELLSVLEEYFNRPHQHRFNANGDISAFVYSNADGEPVLEVSLTQKGRIDKISSQLSDQETKALEKQIKNVILENNGNKIGQTICFIRGTVDTYHRCSHFQLLPMPSVAPKSTMLANTPFLLQFSYPTTSNRRIDGMRRLERERLYINLLTLFIHTYIITNPSSTSTIWTYDAERKLTEQRLPLYFYEDFSSRVDAFSDISEYQQNRPIPAQDYYTGMLAFRNAIIVGQSELRLPDNLCVSFEKVHNLSEKNRANFYHACHWLRQAQTQLPISKSLSLIALITAIESLIEKKRCISCGQERVIAVGHCTECGEPKYKITEAFKGFVEGCLPQMARNLKALSLLYNTRSALVHGSEIFLSDSHPWIDFTENKKAFDQYSIYDQAFVLTKVVLYNWLHGRS